MQQVAFDEASTRRVEMDLDGTARYGAAQTKGMGMEHSYRYRLPDPTAEAQANYNDPQRVQNVRDLIDNETADYGLKHGWSSEVLQVSVGRK